MTVRAIPFGAKQNTFIGASTDTKPTIASHASLPEPYIGSTYFEYNTNILYITYDGTNWVVYNTAMGSGITIGNVGHNKTGIGHGIKTVTSAGTDEALAATTAAKVVLVQAQTDNTGAIAVGASGVDATVATGTGVLLYAGDSITLEIDNLADVYIDATVTGDGVRYLYES